MIHSEDAFIDVIDGLMVHLAAKRQSPKTRVSRRQGLLKFIAFLRDHEVAAFRDVTLDTILAYRRHLDEKGYKPRSVENWLRSVRMLYAYLEDRGLIFENPLAELRLHRSERTLPKVITPAEVVQLLAQPEVTTAVGLRDRAILECLYATGIRREELLGLGIFDVDIDKQTVRVLGKFRKQRVLPLGKHASLYMTEYLKNSRPKLLKDESVDVTCLWVNRFGRPVSEGALSKMIQDYGKKAGLSRPVGPHTLRRSCATHMLNNGAHPVMVAQLLGHADLSTLSRYLRVTITDLKKMHAASKPGR